MSQGQFPTPGSPAPDFRLVDAEGGSVALQELRGQWVVLYFYPKDNTSGCTTEALEFTTLLPEFEALGAAVLGVSRDSAASHRKFTDKHQLGVRLLADPGLEALQSYGAWQLKKTCGKECMGTVRSTLLIDSQGVVRKTWPKVAKAAGHAEAVLQALKELQGEGA